MSEIYLQVEDSKIDLVLSLLRNLKEGIIQDLRVDKEDKELEKYINSPQFQKDKAELNQTLKDIESGKSKPISHKEVWEKIETLTA